MKCLYTKGLSPQTVDVRLLPGGMHGTSVMFEGSQVGTICNDPHGQTVAMSASLFDPAVLGRFSSNKKAVEFLINR